MSGCPSQKGTKLVEVVDPMSTGAAESEGHPSADDPGLQQRSKDTACYLVYCLLCFSLTSALLVAAAWEAMAPSEEAHWRRLRPWEEAAEIVVGAALCAEISISVRKQGRRRFLRNPWRLVDTAVAGLTVLCGAFFLLRRVSDAAIGDVLLEDIDVPVLAMRFALQPLRLLSAASMVVRAGQYRQAAVQVPDSPKFTDPRRPCEGLVRPVLTPELVAELRELLPCYLRFADWELAYSPSVHGTSLSTFYRQQAGPNIIVIKDSSGGLFGAFVTAPWRPTAGSYGGPESFVFSAPHSSSVAALEAAMPEQNSAECVDIAKGMDAQSIPDTTNHAEPLRDIAKGMDAQIIPDTTKPAEPLLEVSWAALGLGRILQWSDGRRFGVGRAFTVQEDFLHGSTDSCETFGSGALSPAGQELVIRDFECWRVGVVD